MKKMLDTSEFLIFCPEITIPFGLILNLALIHHILVSWLHLEFVVCNTSIFFPTETNETYIIFNKKH